MTAMNTARKKGTRMELAAFIPATTMIKLARINTAGALAVLFHIVIHWNLLFIKATQIGKSCVLPSGSMIRKQT